MSPVTQWKTHRPTWIPFIHVYKKKKVEDFWQIFSRNLTYLLSQSQTHWWRPVPLGSWTRWRGVCVVSVAGGSPLSQASSGRRAWGTASHWLAVSWCLNNTRRRFRFFVRSLLLTCFLSSSSSLLQYQCKTDKWCSQSQQNFPLFSDCPAALECNVTHFTRQDAELRVSPAVSSSTSSLSLISYCEVVISK